MTLEQRLACALPVLLANAALVGATGNAECVGLPVVLALGAIARFPRMQASAANELLLAVGAVWLGVVLTPGATDLGALGLHRSHVWSFPFAFALLLVAGARLHLDGAWGGLRATLALGLPVLLVAGGTSHQGATFPLLVVAYLLASAQALHGLDPAWPAWRHVGSRHRRATLCILLLACGIGSGLAAAIPPLWSKALRWALMTGSAARAASGFHEGPMELGALEGMLQNDEIVLRVYGERTDHLRGAVYTRYAGGVWSPEVRRRTMRVHSGALPEAPVTHIRIADEGLTRFFLPLHAAEVSFEPPVAVVDATGVLASDERKAAEQVSFNTAPRTHFTVAPPEPRDVKLPPAIADELRAIAASWTAGAATPEERVAAISARLERDYRYALHFERDGGRDDVLDFLLRVRAGHCEYFASAAALLSRAAGVPARIVTGFRVHEWNPVGSYFVVRKRHAHAWVEVALAEGWVTVDPSPLESFEPSASARMSLVAGIADFLRARYLALESHEVFLLLVLVLAASELRRRLREGRRRSARASAEGPPVWILVLFRWLARRGLVRRRGESLEQFARRSEAQSPTGAALVGRYAALRYGGHGDAAALAREAQTLARERPSQPV